MTTGLAGPAGHDDDGSDELVGVDDDSQDEGEAPMQVEDESIHSFEGHGGRNEHQAVVCCAASTFL